MQALIFDAPDSSGCCLKTEFDLAVPRVSPAGKSQSEPTPIAPEENLRPDWNQSRADGIGDTNPQEARVNPYPRRKRHSESSTRL
jgi:hypothetical protein